MKIRVLIAEDHGVVAGALRSLIEAQPDLAVVACVDNGHAAVQVARRERPDVILMDFAMPELNGAEATRLIRASCPDSRVIMLSMYSTQEYVRLALRSGAAGFVVKQAAATDVIDAIRSVHAGRSYLSPDVAQAVLEDYTADADPDLAAALSSRERQVLQLLAEGHATAAIAKRLSLSTKTVGTYRSRIMAKLGIRDLAGLVRFAIQHGIVTLE